MFASKTSHKRRRSSARGDASRHDVAASRSIITVAGSTEKSKEGEKGPHVSRAWKRLEKVVASHAINHCLQIVLSLSSMKHADNLIKSLPSSSPKCYLARVPLCVFLDPVFITSYIKRGNLVALSRGKLDSEDVACLDGKGVLHLSVTRDTYQSLGLVGQALKQSRIASGKGRDRLSGKVERWMIRIDTLAPSFVPGRPGYDRTLLRLKEWDQRRNESKADSMASWDMLFCWTDLSSHTPSGGDIHFPERHVRPESISEMQIQPVVSVLEDCWIPMQSSRWAKGWKEEEECSDRRLRWESWNEELESFTEWAALISIAADCTRTFSRRDYLNNYQVGSEEEASRRPSCTVKIQYRGFLSSEFCSFVLRTVQSQLTSTLAEAHSDFAFVSCSGFGDSPLAWRMEPVAPTSVEDADPPSDNSKDEEGSDEDMEDDLLYGDYDEQEQTGPRARKRRQKKRKKRGTIDREQVGHQVRQPGSSNCNGWQVLLFADQGEDRAEYVSVENVGGCLKC
ncbi:hypothetical protein CBS101457_002461 [Exobasidium rhododendri]|nr:hypothetical protein CBS101457_002461 [Exobasidium rhododendri]